MLQVVKRYAHTRTDVLVVGGGPAGLSVLTALKNSAKTAHLDCKLVESSDLNKVKRFNQEEYSNRIISLTTKSMDFLQTIGSWKHLNFDKIQFYDKLVAFDSSDNNAVVEFDNEAIDYNPMGAMVEVLNIQRSLLLRLDELDESDSLIDNVRVEKIEKTENWPIVHLSNGDKIQTRLLIGADGYNSPVRHHAGIVSRGWQYDSFGLVGTLKLISDDYNNAAIQRFLNTGPLAILPLVDDNATFVWSCKNQLAQTLRSVTDNEIFTALLNGALKLEEVDLSYIYQMAAKDPNDVNIILEINWRLELYKPGDVEIPTVVSVNGASRAQFPLKMSHADTYIGERVALIGDAAHTIHPLAGQGLNMGQNDVLELVSAIERGVDRGLDIGTPLVLEPYYSNAYPLNHATLGVCDKLHKLFSNDVYPLVVARAWGLKAFNALPVKDWMVRAMSV